jgi:hypothetical protein
MVTLPKVPFASVSHVVTILSPTSAVVCVMQVKCSYQHMSAALDACMRPMYSWYDSL